MEQEEFKAFVVEERDGDFVGKIQSKSTDDLPDGDLLIKVHYSSLNYKDALGDEESRNGNL